MCSIVLSYWLPFCFLVIMCCALIVALCSSWFCIISTNFTEHNILIFLGFCSSVIAVSVLLWCDAASMGKWCLTFWDSVVATECRALIIQLRGATSQKDSDLTTVCWWIICIWFWVCVRTCPFCVSRPLLSSHLCGCRRIYTVLFYPAWLVAFSLY